VNNREVFANFTNANTPIPQFIGNGGFRVGIDASGHAHLIQHNNNGDIKVQMGHTFISSPSEVLKIKSVSSGLSGNVGIGNTGFFEPRSLLHLHRDVDDTYIQIGNGLHFQIDFCTGRA